MAESTFMMNLTQVTTNLEKATHYIAASCFPCIPKRYVVCFLVFCALGINNIFRFSLGLLITVMIRPINTQQTDHINHDLYCPLGEETTTNSSSITGNKHKGEFFWDEFTQGIILSSYFWGYILVQVPGGMIAERVGGKYTLAWAVFVPSVLSVLSPLIVRRGGPWAFVAVRVVSGLGQGFTYPSVNELLSKWAPLEERGRLASTVVAGAYVGNVLCMFVSGLVLSWTDGDWAAVFYLYGGSGLVWLVVWQLLGYSRPEDHPGLSPSERQYLERYAETVNLKKKLPPTPWMSILTSVPAWASALVNLGSNWGKFSSLSNLSKYMTSVLHFSVTQTGLWSSLFYLLMCVGGLLLAMAVDFILAKNIMSVNISRKLMVTIALLGAAVLIAAASFASCDKRMFLVFTALATGLFGFDCAGVGLSSLDLSPNYAGSVTAFINTFGAVGGLLPPYIMGLIITDYNYQSEGRGQQCAFIDNRFNSGLAGLVRGTIFIWDMTNLIASCLPCIPKRYVICLLVFCALGLNYIFRFSLGLLITVMVRPTHTQQTDYIDHDLYCPLGDDTTTNFSSITGNKHKGEFSWDEYTQGIILSSFFWGYIVMQLPGGVLAERGGGKYTMAWAVFVPSLASILTPLIVRRGGPWALVAIRVVSGLGQGFTYPSINELLSKWAPLEERGRLASTVYAGAYVGNVLCMLVSGLVLSWTDGDWAAVFYLYGGSGLVWLVVWQLLGYSRPEDHPGLSPSEREYLEQYAATVNMKKKLPPTPWVDILTSVHMWASALAFLGSNWGMFSTLSNLSKYMTSVLRFSVAQTGLWSALFYVSMCVGAWVSSMAVDCFAAKQIVSVNVSRKLFVTIALLGTAIFIMAASYAGCDSHVFLAFMVLGMGLLGFDCAGVKLSSLDLSPNYAGSVMAFINTVGSVAGILPPYLMGLIITDNTILEWRHVFIITAAVMILTNIFFIFFSSANIQTWNDPTSADDMTDTSSVRVEMRNTRLWLESPGTNSNYRFG